MADPRSFGSDDGEASALDPSKLAVMPVFALPHAPIPQMPSAESADLAELRRSNAMINGKLDQLMLQGYQSGSSVDQGAYQMAAVGAGYGEDQALFTSQRAAYGDVGAMMGGGLRSVGAMGAGLQMGAGRMMSDLGRLVRPVSYTPPAHVMTGYAGRYVQNMGLMSDLRILSGLAEAPVGIRAVDYGYNASQDFGERVGLGVTGFAGSAFSAVTGSAGAMLGGRALGFIGGVAGGLGGFAVGAYAADKVNEGVVARRDVENYLEASSDRFVTASSALADPRRGVGMSRSARMDVANFLREMDFKDPTLDSGQLTDILKGASQLGLLNQSNTIDQFKKKFKDIVENVKVVSTALQTTLEEGLQIMKDFKGIGVDPSQMRSITARAEAAGKVAGRTAAEMVNFGLQGAELFRGTGITMEIGYQQNVMNLSAIRAARDAGTLSQEAVAQAGGEDALAHRMTASTLAYQQSSTARGFGALYFGAGQPGGLNRSAFMNMVGAGGGMDMGQAAIQAAMNLGSPKAIIEYQVNQEKMLSEIGKMYGGQGLQVRQDAETMMQASYASRHTGVDMETGFRFALQQQGIGEPEIQARLARIKNFQKEFEAQQKAAVATRDAAMSEEAHQNFFLYRGAAKIDDAVKGFFDPVSERFNRMTNSIQEWGRTTWEGNVLGVQRATTAGTGVEQYAVDRRGELVSSAELTADRAMSRLNRGVRTTRDGTLVQQVDLTKGGLVAATTGSDMDDLLDRVKSGESGLFDFTVVEKRREGDVSPDVVTDRDGGIQAALGGALERGFSRDAKYEASVRKARVAQQTVQQAEAMAGQVKGELEQVAVAQRRMTADGSITKVKTVGDLACAVFGTDELNEEQYAALQLGTRGNRLFERGFEAVRRDAAVILAGEQGVLVNEQQQDTARVRDSLDRIGGLLGTSDLPASVVAKLAQINEVRGDAAQVEALKNEVLSEVVNTKFAGRFGELIDRATSGDRRLSDEFSEFSRANRYVQQGMREQGGDLMSQAIRKDVFGASAAAFTDAEKVRVTGLVEKLAVATGGEVATLHKDFKEDFELLKKSTSGQQLLKATAAITSMVEGKGADEVASALKNTGIPESQMPGILEAYKSGHSRQAIETVYGLTKDQFASTTNASAAGASQGVGVATGTAQDQYALQTSMNMATYSAMAALAARIGVR